VGGNALIEAHAELADQLLPWAIGMAVLAFALVWLDRRERPRATGDTGGDDVRRADAGPGAPRGLAVAVTVLAVVAGLGTGVQIVRIGHSGAKAVWSKQVASGNQGGEKQGDDH
jgi:hypothetical protein